ncbi:type IV secretory system conjugative DNA transfer family protein [Ekhidna sp.]
MEKIEQLYQAFLSASLAIKLSLIGVVTWCAIFLTLSKRKSWLFLFALPVPFLLSYAITGELMDSMMIGVLIVIPSLILTGLLLVFTTGSEKIKEALYIVPIKTAKSGTLQIDLRRHVGIFGASGSGKTDSGFAALMRHMCKWNVANLLYDHKEWELTMKFMYFYQQAKAISDKPMIPFKTVYIDDPNLSDFINPIAPRYIYDTEILEALSITLFENLSPDDKGGRVWLESGAAVFAGVTWRLKEEWPDKCNLAYATAICITFSGLELIEFIKPNRKAAILASPFIDAKDNERQLASIKSSVSIALKKIATPKMFRVFSEDSFDLAINKKESQAFLAMVNSPSKTRVYSPVLAMTTKLIIDLMSKPGREYCHLMLDEASTFKLPGLNEIVAILRTYNIMVTWGLQDKVQGEILYDLKILKAIISNLTIKFIGKANDPDTAEWYSKLIETIEVDQRSYSQKEPGMLGSSGDKRINVSKQEKAKYKSFEFNRLKQGEFVIIDDKAYDTKDRLELIEDFETLYNEGKMPTPEKKHNYTPEEIELYFDSIFDQIEELRPEIPEEEEY